MSVASLGGHHCKSFSHSYVDRWPSARTPGKRIGSLYLPGVRITVAIQVREVYGMWITIEIHNHLMQKVGIVILRIDFQRLVSNGDVESRTDTHIPSLFLLQVWVDDDLSSTGEQIVVLCQNVIRAITLTDGTS